MSDKVESLTVVLEKPVSEQEAACLTAAIQMLKGVLSVKTHVSDISTYIAETRAKNDIAMKIVGILRRD